MKLGFIEIKIVRTSSKNEDNKGTLIVTGQCDNKKLEELEEHCKDNNIKAIATNLPVLGVFNLDGASSIDGTKK